MRPSGSISTDASVAVGSAAVILGDAGHAGADHDPGLLSARFLRRALLPDRVLLQLVENLRRADRDAVGISRHGLSAGLERIAPPELDRIERQRRGGFVDQDLQRRHRLQRSIAAHRPGGNAARMEGDRGDVDFRNVVDADRGGGGDGRHVGGKIGESAAIEDMVGGECLDPAASPDRSRSACAS